MRSACSGDHSVEPPPRCAPLTCRKNLFLSPGRPQETNSECPGLLTAPGKRVQPALVFECCICLLGHLTGDARLRIAAEQTPGPTGGNCASVDTARWMPGRAGLLRISSISRTGSMEEREDNLMNEVRDRTHLPRSHLAQRPEDVESPQRTGKAAKDSSESGASETDS